MSRPASATPTSGSCRRTAPPPPRLLVGGDKTENTPRWISDGRARVPVQSRRRHADLRRQRRRAEPEVHQVTKIAGGVQPPLVVSPDGRSIAFVADVKTGEDTPPNVHVLKRLLYRHWDEWRENVRHHVFVASLSRRRAARSDARRLRLAADAAGRRGDRVHARRQRGRVRLEPRRDRQGSVLDEQRRLVGAGGGRDRRRS